MAPGRTDDLADINPPKAPLEPGLSEVKANWERPNFPRPPKFDDPYKEREYLKGRLAAAFRIFGKYGFDEVLFRISPAPLYTVILMSNP